MLGRVLSRVYALAEVETVSSHDRRSVISALQSSLHAQVRSELNRTRESVLEL